MLQVLDRTKALRGPRTQAYGETKYIKEILQVLDRTKALHGPRTQAYGETNYLKNKNKKKKKKKTTMAHKPQNPSEENSSLTVGSIP